MRETHEAGMTVRKKIQLVFVILACGFGAYAIFRGFYYHLRSLYEEPWIYFEFLFVAAAICLSQRED